MPTKKISNGTSSVFNEVVIAKEGELLLRNTEIKCLEERRKAMIERHSKELHSITTEIQEQTQVAEDLQKAILILKAMSK